MAIQFVLIDLENVQPKTLAAADRAELNVIVFTGAAQQKVPYELADALQRMGERARYIRIAGNGPNALDFHIAFYIGELAHANPGASFLIVSNDGGFDPLIKHLRARSIVVSRSPDLGGLAPKSAPPRSADERIATVLARLRSLNGGRPRTVKTLSNAIAAMFQKQLPESDIAAIVQCLQRGGSITVKDNKVAYAPQ